MRSHPATVPVRLAAELLGHLGVDADVADAAASPDGRSCAWWPGGLRQTLVSAPSGMVVVRTDVVADVAAGADEVAQYLALVNAEPALTALVHEPTARRIVAVSAAPAEPAGGYGGQPPGLLALAALLGAGEAHDLAGILAGRLGGRVAGDAAGGGEPRVAAGALETFTLREIALPGLLNSPFTEADFSAAAVLPEWEAVTADPDGLTGELSFSGAAPVALGFETTHANSAVHLSNFRDHARYGSGCDVSLCPPLRFDDDDLAAAVAGALNRAGASAGATTPLLGAWTSLPGGGTLTFAGFVPAAARRDGLVAEVCAGVARLNRSAAVRLLEGADAR